MSFFNLSEKTIIIIGGSSGIGLATAQMALKLKAKVIIAGRAQEKLKKALEHLKSKDCQAIMLDNRQAKNLEDFFQNIAAFDHLFTPGASYVRGPISAELEVAESCFRGKFWPQYWAVKYGHKKIAKDGSIVLMSGAFSQRPPNDGASYAACNGAIESLAKALAVELAPIRVNAVAPGTVKTEFVWEDKGKEARENLYREYAKECILKKIGNAEDIALSVLYLMSNAYTTGSTLYPDGGYTLR